MKKILFFLYVVSLQANEQGCTISFFTKEKAPCSAEKKQISIAPIIIKKAPKKKANDTKKIEGELRTILKNVKQYKNDNEIERNRLSKELSIMKKKFNNYKIEKDKELKKVKKQLYVSNKKEHEKIKKLKKELYLTNKELDDSKKTIILKSIKKQPTTIHKIIREMKPIPVLMHNTPWIEITVEDNINIYDLALKYYGDSQEYTKIYAANQNIINNNYQINNGMSLIIPITENFQEQPMMLNSN